MSSHNMEGNILNNGRLELLVGSNYHQWVIKMKAILKAKKLFKTIIESDIPIKPDDMTTSAGKEWEAWEERNDEAFSILILSLSPEQAGMFANEDIARNLWYDLEKMYSGNKKDRIVDIMLQLKDIKMGSSESVDHYITRTKNLLSQIQSFGGNLDTREFVFYIVRGIHEKFENVAVVLRSRRDVTVEEAQSVLREEENRTKMNSKGGVLTSDGAFRSKERKYNQNTQPEQLKSKECYICHRKGHLAKHCWHRQDQSKSKQERRNTWTTHRKTTAKVATSRDEAALRAGRHNRFTESRRMETEKWNLDSGCTVHMTSDSDGIFDTQNHQSEIQLAESGRKINSTIRGKLRMSIITNEGETKARLDNVLYVPDLKDNLMSVSELVRQGNTVTFNQDGATIYGPKGNMITRTNELNGMYTLKVQRTYEENKEGEDEACKVVTCIPKITLWHRRLGHVNTEYMNFMKNNQMVVGLNYRPEKQFKCNECILGKLSRQPFKTINQEQAQRPLELLHMDLCGPLPEISLGGNKYIMVIVDTYTRRVFVILLKNKYDAYDSFLNFKARRENQLQLSVKHVRTDNGLEFINNKFDALFKKSGIKHEKTVPSNPESNGLAERTNRTLLDTARTMLIDANLPLNFWGEAVLTAAYLRNCSYRKSLGNKTPMEQWSGRKPKIQHLRIFGSLCHSWINKSQRHKLQARAQPGIFVGYSRCRTAYRIYIPTTGKILESRDVKFDEDIKGSTLLKEGENNISNEESLPYISPEILNFGDHRHKVNQDQHEIINIEPPQNSESDNEETTEPIPEGENRIRGNEEIETQPVGKVKGRPVGTIKGVVERREKEERRTQEEELKNRGVRRSTRVKKDESAQIVDNGNVEKTETYIPNNYKQAINSEDRSEWIKAMEEELESLENRGVWELVERKDNMRVIKNRWIYTLKNGDDVKKRRFKARLVAMGNHQRPGIDFENTYAPVIKYESLRLLIAIAAQFNMKIHRYDVKTAYLYGDIKEEIFMEQAVGKSENMRKVCRLKKSIYGLPQSGYNWNQKLNSVLEKIGFQRIECEPSIYIIKNGKDKIYLGSYVDDLIVIGSNGTWMHEVMSKIKNEFEIREELGDGNYLGLEICKMQNGYSLGQRKHIEKLLWQNGMRDCNPVKIPIDLNIKLEEYEESKKVDSTKFQEIIGSLLYIARGTRPDITFAVNSLSQYSRDPRELHLTAIKKILRYLKGTINKKLYFDNNSGQVQIYSDASWSTSRDQRSQSGYCVKLGSATISWNSKRQDLIALSTCEAEINAICEAVKEAAWLRNLMEELELGKLMEKPTAIYTDSKAAIDWSGNLAVKQRTKHFGRKLYKIRETIRNNEIKLVHKPGKELEADMLTKGIGIEALERTCISLGLKNEKIKDCQRK